MEKSERLLNAINCFELISKGSLWIVDEKIWDSAIDGFIPKRKGHPGLVFALKRYKSLEDTVPMMIGSSRKVGYSLCVKNVFDDKSEKKETFFTAIRPKPISVDDAPSSGLVANRFAGKHTGISRNPYKSLLDADEMAELDKYLLRKGVRL